MPVNKFSNRVILVLAGIVLPDNLHNRILEGQRGDGGSITVGNIYGNLIGYGNFACIPVFTKILIFLYIKIL